VGGEPAADAALEQLGGRVVEGGGGPGCREVELGGGRLAAKMVGGG
jgi:hypothetical protein